MKTIKTKLFLFIFLTSSIAFSQSKVKERNVIGAWKLHLNLEEKVKKETKGDNAFEKALARGIVGTIDELAEEADITFNFKRDNTLEVTQKGILNDDDEETTEYYEWKITKEGKLVTTKTDGGSFKFNDNDGWMLKRGKLVPVDGDNNIEEGVWLEKN